MFKRASRRQAKAQDFTTFEDHSKLFPIIGKHFSKNDGSHDPPAPKRMSTSLKEKRLSPAKVADKIAAFSIFSKSRHPGNANNNTKDFFKSASSVSHTTACTSSHRPAWSVFTLQKPGQKNMMKCALRGGRTKSPPAPCVYEKRNHGYGVIRLYDMDRPEQVIRRTASLPARLNRKKPSPIPIAPLSKAIDIPCAKTPLTHTNDSFDRLFDTNIESQERNDSIVSGSPGLEIDAMPALRRLQAHNQGKDRNQFMD